ncbi:MAG: protein kinase [Rudaea sp.]
MPDQRDAEATSTTGARLRDAFDILSEMDALNREAWLAANVDDADQRVALRRLLSEEHDRGFLDLSLVEHAFRLDSEDVRPEGLIGRDIGGFRIVRLLGQGGMAAVFLGERSDSDFEQNVAVKILRRGLYSELEQRLFLRERQLLAGLNHPNIARMIDGGVTDAGIPYLVMEFVDGEPITRYAAMCDFSVRQRAELFLTVCRAVEAAHRNLIVHRDIKPSNILVSTDGVVKLLDFGIAKLLEEENTDATGTIGVFTPNYAAPEQISGGIITTATDVYGLGVTFHELLLGVRPDGATSRRPSSRVTDALRTTQADGDTLIPSIQLRTALRGDLDNILLKALAEEPERRYPSAGALADDVERYLKRRPVLAHPPSRWYRASKFVTRHRGGVALSAVFVLGLFAALGVTLWQASVARLQAQRANETRDFMVDLFQTASADLPRDQRPTPQQLVEEAAKRARDDVDLAEPVRVDVLFTLGKVTLANGDYKQAETLLDDAIARYLALGLPQDTPEWLGILVEKGNLLQRTNRNAEADRLMMAELPQLQAQDSEPAVSGLMLLGATRASSGDATQAVSIALQAAHKAERVFGPDSVNTIETLTYLGQLCAQLRRYRESVALLEPVIARWHSLKLPEDEQLARTLLHLASAHEHLDDAPHASIEALYVRSIALMRQIFDKPHDRLATALGGYARFLIRCDRFDDAQAALDEALKIDRAVLGDEHVRTALLLDTLGELDHARHDNAAAEKSASQAVAILAAHAREAGFEPELTAARIHLAAILIGAGRFDDAAAQLATIKADLPRNFGESSAENADVIGLHARIVLSHGDATDALADTQRGLAIISTLDRPVPSTKIDLLRTQADASSALTHYDAALKDVAQALETLLATNSEARVQHTELLVQKSRIAQASGDANGTAAAIADARALGVPVALLSPTDASVIAATKK